MPKIKMIKITKMVYIEREDGVLCVATPTQFPWGIRFHLAEDRGRVIVLKIASHLLTDVWQLSSKCGACQLR